MSSPICKIDSLDYEFILFDVAIYDEILLSRYVNVMIDIDKFFSVTVVINSC